MYTFAQAGTYTVQVQGVDGTFGPYRFKVSPKTAWSTAGPRVYATSPDGGQSIDVMCQITMWFDDQLDPSTLTAQNVIVRGAKSGVVAGTAVFDPLYATLTWTASTVLCPDNLQIP